MASVSVLLKKDYKSRDHRYPIIIRLKAGKQARSVPTGYKVLEKQFRSGEVVKHEDADIINSVISDKIYKAKKYFADCVINEKPVNLQTIFQKKASSNFCNYILHRAQQYKENGKIVMWQKLTRFEKELTECFKGKVFLDEITTDTCRIFESYLTANKNQANTIAKKFRFLKQLFQSALDEGLHTGSNPFKKYKIQTYPVKKEKLTPEEILAIEKLDLSGHVNDARNLFLFSYYAKGVRFENCIFLKRENIRDGRIYFTTNKGKKHISVLINSKLKNILDQYPADDFIFPFVETMPVDAYQYRAIKDSANSMVNRFLKIVGGLAGIKIHLTFHLSRHSIAYHLKQSGADIHSIKDILGHSDTRVTEVYLKTLDDERLDSDMRKLFGD